MKAQPATAHTKRLQLCNANLCSTHPDLDACLTGCAVLVTKRRNACVTRCQYPLKYCSALSVGGPSQSCKQPTHCTDSLSSPPTVCLACAQALKELSASALQKPTSCLLRPSCLASAPCAPVGTSAAQPLRCRWCCYSCLPQSCTQQAGRYFGPTDSAPAAPAPAPSLPPSANVGDVWWAQATGWFCNPVAVTTTGAAQPVRGAPCAGVAANASLSEVRERHPAVKCCGSVHTFTAGQPAEVQEQAPFLSSQTLAYYIGQCTMQEIWTVLLALTTGSAACCATCLWYMLPGCDAKHGLAALPRSVQRSGQGKLCSCSTSLR